MWDEKKMNAIEARVRVVCGGTVEVEFVPSLEDGACTIKLSEGNYIRGLSGTWGPWKQVLPLHNDDVALHELAHMKCSSFASTAAYNSLAKRGQDLYVMLEEVRVDLIASNHWHCNVHTNHGKQLAEGMASMGDGESLKDIVTRIGYGILMPLTSPLSQDVESMFGNRIRALGEGDDPLVAVRLAFEIDAAYPDDPEPDQPEPDTDGEGQPDDDGEGQPDTDGEGDDGEGKGQDQDQDEGQDEGQDEITGKPMTAWDEIDWQKLLDEIKELEKELRETAAENIKEQGRQDRYDGDAPYNVNTLPDGTYALEPVVLESTTQLALDQMQGQRGDRRERVGAVTGDVWRLNQGTVDVFRSPVRNKGKTVVMTDLSSSMKRWCACCSKADDESGMPTNGYLAMQVTGAVSLATDATCMGFSSGSIWEWDAGMQPADHNGPQVGGGGTPTAMALMHMKEVLHGETAGALGVLVTDGMPDDREATRKAAEQLYSEGLDYVVVIVMGGVGDSIPKSQMSQWGEIFKTMFPSAPIVYVTEVEDIGDVGEAIVREIN